MDVKGAYLNGTLSETVFMKQPEGYSDGTNHVCQLIKTLYSLKQSAREWNIELDMKLKKYNFSRLQSDDCAYIQKDHDDSEIITIWVDDLLLFTTSDLLMERMKDNIWLEWETTDLGEPTKIVGIEIIRTGNNISITQEKYIENILNKERMSDANLVAIPIDPNQRFTPNPDGNEGNCSNSYACLLGELQLLFNECTHLCKYTLESRMDEGIWSYPAKTFPNGKWCKRNT